MHSVFFDAAALPSAPRKVKAKGKFKARPCDKPKPKAETHGLKRLSLPQSPPGPKGATGDAEMEKPPL